MNRMILRPLFTAILCLVASLPCSAQTGVSSSASAPITSGHVADSAAGEVGQRQTRYQAAQGIAPKARIASRIQSRVQSRIQNRIDRNYAVQANPTSSLVAAGNRARNAEQSTR